MRARYSGPARELSREQVLYDIALNNFKDGARNRLGQAVREGRIARLPCEWPDTNHKGRIEGHHPDYSRPYEVIWLCVKHHNDLHSVNPYLAPIPEDFKYVRT